MDKWREEKKELKRNMEKMRDRIEELERGGSTKNEGDRRGRR